MENKNIPMRRSLVRMPGWPTPGCSTLVAALVFVVGISTGAAAYTTVQVAPGSPPGLEASFIAATTSQFSATLITNPFFGGTFGVVLQGINPRFDPAPKMSDLLSALVTVDSYTYVAGWANGESYQQFVQASATANFAPLCASATNFMLIAATTATWNPATCQDTVYQILSGIYALNLSTPTTVPGNWQ